ncbi:MAG TPA: hypothetical protein VIZ19_03485, partial [Roseiarcus sp.]
QSPDAPLAPPLNLTGLQLGTGGRGGRPSQPAPFPPQTFTRQAKAAGPRGAPGGADDGDLLPPAEIPNGGRGPSAKDKGLLSKLFGTP